MKIYTIQYNNIYAEDFENHYSDYFDSAEEMFSKYPEKFFKSEQDARQFIIESSKKAEEEYLKILDPMGTEQLPVLKLMLEMSKCEEYTDWDYVHAIEKKILAIDFYTGE